MVPANDNPMPDCIRLEMEIFKAVCEMTDKFGIDYAAGTLAGNLRGLSEMRKHIISLLRDE